MSDKQGAGSILLKLVVVIFVVALIVVITIPGEIWTSEEQATKICRENMVSLYEAHIYYYKLKESYASDMENLILTIQNDSSLLKRELVVSHTVRLRDAMESFLNSNLIDGLHTIASNLKNIGDDFVANARYFKSQDEEVLSKNIFTRSEELKMRISNFRSGVEFENYRIVIQELDSLWQVRRDLSDYSLQTAARWASHLSESIVLGLPNIDYASLKQTWEPLSDDITDFLNTVNSIGKLKSATTVADRVADFQGKIETGFSNATSSGVSDAQVKSQDLVAVYQEFLNDFIITQFYAQYRLSDTDSFLLALNEDNFVTPDDRIPYIVSLGDSLDIRVEDPTLLEELKNRSTPLSEIAGQLPFMTGFKEYSRTLDSLQTFYLEVKRTYRRNLDVTIKTKELDDLIPRIKDVGAFTAYNSLSAFAEIVPESDSYSEIQELIGEGLISSGSFIQIYKDNFFGRLDTLHLELLGHLNEFESIVSEVRRNRFSFTWAVDQSNLNLNLIKSPTSAEVTPDLTKIKSGLEKLFIYASEGDKRTVYGIFNTQIVNHGKVFGKSAHKSWEDGE